MVMFWLSGTHASVHAVLKLVSNDTYDKDCKVKLATYFWHHM